MTANLTYDELIAIADTLTEPTNDCDEGCAGGMPGVLAPCFPDGDESHLFIECCDTCLRYPDDTAAAEAFAAATGLVVKYRFDNGTLRYWRPFIARPGSTDARDVYGVGSNWCGCYPDHEVALERAS